MEFSKVKYSIENWFSKLHMKSMKSDQIRKCVK